MRKVRHNDFPSGAVWRNPACATRACPYRGWVVAHWRATRPPLAAQCGANGATWRTSLPAPSKQERQWRGVRAARMLGSIGKFWAASPVAPRLFGAIEWVAGKMGERPEDFAYLWEDVCHSYKRTSGLRSIALKS